jgi:hypothetical protein
MGTPVVCLYNNDYIDEIKLQYLVGLIHLCPVIDSLLDLLEDINP